MSNGDKPTVVLKKEYERVLQKLDTLENIIGILDKKEEISAKLKELASFFGADFWVHFTKEEEALFPEMEIFIPRDSGPIGVMLMEHEELRSTNSKI